MKFLSECFLAQALPFCLAASILVTLQPCMALGAKHVSAYGLQPVSLTLVALNGTEVVLNEVDIGNLPSYRAYGGYKNQLGNIRGLGNYTGVPISTLCDLVGGIDGNNSVRITASDGYSKTISYEQANGDFITYDNVTGQQVPHNQSLTPILAYYKNDLNLTLDEGPLRLAIAGPEGLVTDSIYWVKYVNRLEIRYRNGVAISTVTPSKNVVAQNYTCQINVTAENKGGYTENFTVTLRANGTAVTAQNITLMSKTSTVIAFTWNTASYARGNYTVSAVASIVPDETNTTDNTFTDGWIVVSLIGDINGDRKVDVKDIYRIAQAYGSSPGYPQWNPDCDINNDEKVDVKDYYIACKHYGESDI